MQVGLSRVEVGTRYCSAIHRGKLQRNVRILERKLQGSVRGQRVAESSCKEASWGKLLGVEAVQKCHVLEGKSCRIVLEQPGASQAVTILPPLK